MPINYASVEANASRYALKPKTGCSKAEKQPTNSSNYFVRPAQTHNDCAR